MSEMGLVEQVARTICIASVTIVAKNDSPYEMKVTVAGVEYIR